jgi:hypothetical protein
MTKLKPGVGKYVLFLSAWYPNRNDPMFGSFSERHALAIAGYRRVITLYVHKELRKSGPKTEFVWETGDTYQALRIYFRNSRIPFSLLRRFFNFCWYYRLTFAGWRKILRREGLPEVTHVNVLTRCEAWCTVYRNRTLVPLSPGKLFISGIFQDVVDQTDRETSIHNHLSISES